MQQYEICFITTKEDDKKTVLDLLKKQDVKVLHEQNIGHRKFAYPIKKEGAGFYGSIYFDLDNKKMGELNKNLLSEQKVLRFLMVKNDVDVKKLDAQGKIIQKLQPKKKVLEIKEPTVAEKAVKEIKITEKPKREIETKKAVKIKKTLQTAKSKEKIESAEVLEKNTQKNAAADEAERIKKLEEKLDELLKE